MPKKPPKKSPPKPLKSFGVPRTPPSAPAGLTLEWIDPKALTENPRNWRRHPDSQLAAITEALTQIGWVGACLFNRQTNRLVDGHARVKVAIAKGIAAVPVLIGNWNEKDEAKILATLDPIGAMATADPQMLRSLMAEADLQGEGFADLLDNLNLMAQLEPPPAEPESKSAAIGDLQDQFIIIIKCRDEPEHARLIDRFDSEGLDFTAPVA